MPPIFLPRFTLRFNNSVAPFFEDEDSLGTPTSVPGFSPRAESPKLSSQDKHTSRPFMTRRHSWKLPSPQTNTTRSSVSHCHPANFTSVQSGPGEQVPKCSRCGLLAESHSSYISADLAEARDTASPITAIRLSNKTLIRAKRGRSSSQEATGPKIRLDEREGKSRRRRRHRSTALVPVLPDKVDSREETVRFDHSRSPTIEVEVSKRDTNTILDDARAQAC